MASLQAPRSAAPVTPLRRIARTRFAGIAGGLGALLLAGCSTGGDYPSLARWPKAQVAPQPAPQPSGQIDAPPAPRQVQATPGAGCDAALADTIDSEFRNALPATEAALKNAGGTQPGTPAWSKGNIAMAELQKIRARLDQVLAPAEAAYVADTIDHAQEDAQIGGSMRADGARLAACRAHIDTLATQQDAQIDRLRALLPD